MKRFLIILIPVFIAGVLLVECKKHNDVKVSILSGYVVDESGVAIANATIKVSGQMLTSGNDGTFVLSKLPGDATLRLEVSAPGYFTNYKNAENLDGSSVFVPVTLIAKSVLGTLPAAGGSVGATGLRVIAPSGAFKNPDGTTYTGQVNVAARYITKTNTTLANLMPGGDFKATNANGTEGGMRTYGFVATEFTDTHGNVLTATANVKAAITTPATVGNPITQNAQCWGYDPASGNWTGATTITNTGPEYFFPCTTVYQNVDLFITTGTITGKVTCTSGKPASYVTITVTNKYNMYVTSSNENGNYKITAEVTSSNPYSVAATGGSSVTVNTVSANQETQASTLTVNTCTGSNGNGNGTTGGSFSFNGNTYSGACGSTTDVGTGGASGNIDVAIAIASGASFFIYNMPKQSSGTYSFTDGFMNVGGSALYGLLNVGTTEVATKSGTLTKTGASSFNFTCVVYDINSNQTYNVTGSGTY